MWNGWVFRRETARGFCPFGDAIDLVRGRRQKAIFYVFVSVSQYFSTEPYLFIIVGGSWHVNVVG